MARVVIESYLVSQPSRAKRYYALYSDGTLRAAAHESEGHWRAVGIVTAARGVTRSTLEFDFAEEAPSIVVEMPSAFWARRWLAAADAAVRGPAATERHRVDAEDASWEGYLALASGKKQAYYALTTSLTQCDLTCYVDEGKMPFEGVWRRRVTKVAADAKSPKGLTLSFDGGPALTLRAHSGFEALLWRERLAHALEAAQRAASGAAPGAAEDGEPGAVEPRVRRIRQTHAVASHEYGKVYVHAYASLGLALEAWKRKSNLVASALYVLQGAKWQGVAGKSYGTKAALRDIEAAIQGAMAQRRRHSDEDDVDADEAPRDHEEKKDEALRAAGAAVEAPDAAPVPRDARAAEPAAEDASTPAVAEAAPPEDASTPAERVRAASALRMSDSTDFADDGDDDDDDEAASRFPAAPFLFFSCCSADGAR
ncbi:hypothetical protein M885DRAFT_591596 [Pelagophyceae sp. CCMP2097]|nr:hypothetical protein M885DRAFT_591596 [Pelagophyceae sp. CCMP2097]